MVSSIDFQVESTFPSAQFETDFEFGGAFQSLRNRFDIGDEFIQDIKTAFNPNESLARESGFEPFLEVDSMFDNVAHAARNAPELGASSADVTGGSVTLSSGSESLTIQSFENVELMKSQNNTVVVFNRTADEAIRVEAGETINVSGEGQLSVPENETEGSLRLSGGESATVTETNDSLLLKETSANASLTIPEDGRSFSVPEVSNRALALFSGPNSSIDIEPGQQGTFRRGEDNNLVIANETTGETLTVDPGTDLSTAGASSVTFSGESLEFQGGDPLSVQQGDDGELSLQNTAVTSEATVEAPSTPTDGQNTRFNTISNPEATQTRILGALLPVTRGPTRGETDQLRVSLDQVIKPLSERSLDELPRAESGGDFAAFQSENPDDADQSGPLTAERGISETFEMAEAFVNNDIEFPAEAITSEAEPAFEIQDADGETLLAISEQRSDGPFSAGESEDQFVDINDETTGPLLDGPTDEFIDTEQ